MTNVSAPFKRARTPKEDRDLLKPVWERCFAKLKSCGDDILALPQPWRAIYTTFMLDAEVRNGGFHQFFWNTEGTLNEATRADLELIGASQFHELFKRATSTATEFEVIEAKYRSRGDVGDFKAGYDTIPWDTLDRAFYEASPTILEYMARYVRDHASAFEADI